MVEPVFLRPLRSFAIQSVRGGSADSAKAVAGRGDKSGRLSELPNFVGNAVDGCEAIGAGAADA